MAKGFVYKLGEMVFSSEGINPETVSIDSEYRWAAIDRLIQRPAHQWTGPGMEDLILDGTIYPTYNPYGDSRVVGIHKMRDIRSLAEQGLPLPLTDGKGNYFGRFVIKSITEKKNHLMDDGSPLKQDFTIKLSRYGEDAKDTSGIIYSTNPSDQQGIFTAPRIPSGDSPGAGSPAVISYA